MDISIIPASQALWLLVDIARWPLPVAECYIKKKHFQFTKVRPHFEQVRALVEAVFSQPKTNLNDCLNGIPVLPMGASSQTFEHDQVGIWTGIFYLPRPFEFLQLIDCRLRMATILERQ